MFASVFNSVRAAVASSAARAGYATEGQGLVLNFALPHRALYTEQAVKQVTLPAVSGEMGVLSNHVPVITELAPGLVTVIGHDDATTSLFISGGFAVVDADSRLSVSSLEAFPLDDIDPATAKSEYDRYTQLHHEAVVSGNVDLEAEAEIGLDVFKSMLTALSAGAR